MTTKLKTPPLRRAVKYLGGSDKLHGYYRFALYLLECGHVASVPAGGGWRDRRRCYGCQYGEPVTISAESRAAIREFKRSTR